MTFYYVPFDAFVAVNVLKSIYTSFLIAKSGRYS